MRQPSPAPGETMDDLLLIDSHTHIYRTAEIGRQAVSGLNPDLLWYGTVPELLQCMEQAGVSHAVVLTVTPTREMREKAEAALPPDLPEPRRREELEAIRVRMVERMRRNNAWGAQVGREHPNLFPFVNVDPFIMSAQEWHDELDSLRRAGARGIKLLPIQHLFRGDHRALWPIYDYAQAHDMPILTQSGDSRVGHEEEPWGRPAPFAAALEEFPRLKLIMAHFGRGFEQEVVELAQRFPGAYFDLSSRFPGDRRGGHWSAEELVGWVRRAGVGHVLFGSNWPIYDMLQDAALARALPFTPDERRAVLRDNAAALLAVG